MEKSSRIYIAGHKGMVGSAITNILRKKGYSRLISKTFNELDLTRQGLVDDFFRTELPEYVFIAAAKVGGIMANNKLRADFIYDNLMIQSNIINASWRYGVKKLIFLGSTCIYPKNAPQPIKEEYLLSSPLEFTNEPYAVAKIAGLKMCESYNLQYSTNYISVMPTNLYGPADNFDLDKSHVLPALLRKFHLASCLEQDNWNAIKRDLDKNNIRSFSGNATNNEILALLEQYGIKSISGNSGQAGKDITVTVWGSGKPKREFMYSQDMAEACVYLMENVDIDDLIKVHKIKNDRINPPHFLNIGTGAEISIKELAERIAALTGFKGKIVFDTSKPDGTYRKVTDTTVLKSLGFEPKTSLDDGLKYVYKEYTS